MKKRVVSAVLCALTAFSLMAATASCGSDNERQAETSVPAPTEAPAATPTTAPAAAPTEAPAEAPPAADPEPAAAALQDESGSLEKVVVPVAGDAMLIASSARYEGNAPKYVDGSACDWPEGAELYWEINVEKAGQYEISLNYGTEDGEGGRGTVSVSGSSAVFSAIPTGGADELEKLDVLTANLTPGENRLTITADTAVKSLMHLKRVVLVKASDMIFVSGEQDTELLPDNALYGSSGPGNEGGRNIGGWQKDGVVTWQLEVTEGGKYDIILYHAGDTDTGGMGVVEAAGKSLEFEVEPTGGWGDYRDKNIGAIVLMPGKTDLVLRPTEMVSDWYMNLQKAVLKRIGDAAVPVADSGITTLYPDDAVCGGGAVNQHDDIGGWVEGAYASWTLEVPADGNYKVTVYGAAPDGMGGIGRMSFARMEKEFEIVPTGDWGNYTDYDAGIIGLRQGAYDLLLDGALYYDNWLFNCHKIELEYIGEFNPVVDVKGEETRIPASAAVLNGPGLEGDLFFNTGGWQRGASVSWTLNVAEAGEYDLYMEYGSDNGCGGAGYIKINGESTDINVEPTGGWGNYEDTYFGAFQLPEGEVILEIESAEAAQDWYMNLHVVKLVRK